MTINNTFKTENKYRDRVVVSMAYQNINLNYIKELRQIHGLSYREIYLLIKEAVQNENK
jgi:hypothetical protein